MKRISLIFLIALAYLLSSCSPKTEYTPTGETTASAAEITTASSSETVESTSTQQIEVEKGLLNVKITLPASLFKDSQSTHEELEAAAKEQGIKNVTFNNDGSVTYEMSKDIHKKLVDSMKESIDTSITEMLSDPDGTNSFKSITYNNDCSEFSVFVDRSKYNEWSNLAALGFYVQGAYYQSFQGSNPDEIKVIVKFIDNETKEVISTADSSKMAD